MSYFVCLTRDRPTRTQLRQKRRAEMNTPHHSIPVSSEIHSYGDLLQKIHNDLRIQHPEWVEPNGESPICDDYEARLLEQLNALARQGANEPDHALSVG